MQVGLLYIYRRLPRNETLSEERSVRGGWGRPTHTGPVPNQQRFKNIDVLRSNFEVNLQV